MRTHGFVTSIFVYDIVSSDHVGNVRYLDVSHFNYFVSFPYCSQVCSTNY